MGTLVTRREVETALALVADGRTMRQIGDVLKRHPSHINKILLECPEEYEEAKERRRDRIRSERWERAFDRSDKWSAKFLDDLSMEQLPETRAARAQKVDVEHTGSVLQEVTLEHDFGKLLDKLAEVGLIQRGPAELADAASVALLPASPD